MDTATRAIALPILSGLERKLDAEDEAVAEKMRRPSVGKTSAVQSGRRGCPIRGAADRCGPLRRVPMPGPRLPDPRLVQVCRPRTYTEQMQALRLFFALEDVEPVIWRRVLGPSASGSTVCVT
jgi:hypothetical protein